MKFWNNLFILTIFFVLACFLWAFLYIASFPDITPPQDSIIFNLGGNGKWFPVVNTSTPAMTWPKTTRNPILTTPTTILQPCFHLSNGDCLNN